MKRTLAYNDTSELPNRENSYNQHQKLLENNISGVVVFVRDRDRAAHGPMSGISLVGVDLYPSAVRPPGGATLETRR